MYYYTRHIGDYAASTAHLSMLEHGAYQLLLDQHYLTEKPLPSDIALLSRIVRATSKPEIAAIKAVLAEFWIETEDGWAQKRAQSEMLKYHEKSAVNKASGSLGGRPRKEKTETERKPNGLANGLANGNRTVLKTQTIQNPNQEPITNNQEESIVQQQNIPPGLGRAPPGKPGDVLDSTWADFLALRKAKRSPMTATALNAIRSEAGLAGLSLQAALVECCARGWQGFRADWVQQGQPRASPRHGPANAKQAATERFWEQMNGQRGEVRDAIDGEAVRVG